MDVDTYPAVGTELMVGELAAEAVGGECCRRGGMDGEGSFERVGQDCSILQKDQWMF